MITQRQSDSINVQHESVLEPAKSNEIKAEEQQYRSAAYKVLAGLLRTAPDNDALDKVSAFAGIESQQDELALEMSMLGVSASTASAESVEDEFHELFIGLGRGELMPYASWYLTGYLMEKPLSKLREELSSLGYERSEDVHEPEDLAAALCEVMAMMIDDGCSIPQQADFFSRHLSTWLESFLADLSQANAAVFYRSVGRFGQAFSGFEKHYLTMQV